MKRYIQKSVDIAKAYKSLTLPDESYFSAPEESLRDELDKVISKWNHLLKIKVILPKNFPDLDEFISQDIGNVVNEALANSFRHGEATNVTITFSAEKRDVVLKISDNGVGPNKGKAGLGSETFAALAGNSWSLAKSAKGKGASLTMKIHNVI